jgi:hypothetical protein
MRVNSHLFTVANRIQCRTDTNRPILSVRHCHYSSGNDSDDCCVRYRRGKPPCTMTFVNRVTWRAEFGRQFQARPLPVCGIRGKHPSDRPRRGNVDQFSPVTPYIGHNRSGMASLALA